VLYLYAFAEQPATIPETSGLGGAALAIEDMDGLGAVVSPVDSQDVRPSEEAVLTHGQVVEAVFSVNDAVVPARFGRAYADRDSLLQALSERLDDVRNALSRVRGCVELGLRAIPPPEPRAAADSGRQYMLDRLHEARRLARLADDLNAPLTELSRAATGVQTSSRLLSAAYLVPRSQVDEFRGAVRELEKRHPEVTLVCTGPWPPYSFATADPDRR
jgi:hypothetical protein